MTIHLIKDTELSAEVFTAVYDLLTAVDGTIQFKCDPESIVDFTEEDLYLNRYEDEREYGQMKMPPKHSIIQSDSRRSFPAEVKTATWEILFNKCNKYRRSREIPNEEMVLLLTDISNTHNWFASLDEMQPTNGFIHTADWDMFLSCPKQFPIAYEVIALLMHKYTFDSDRPIIDQVHHRAIGCVSDFCMKKSEIILKMRTADVCGECMTKLKARMPMQDIMHALNIMDSLRLKMLYAQNFKQHVELSKIVIIDRDNKKRICLPDFGNIEIRLTPMEMTLYILFMKYPEGLYLSDLKNHVAELEEIYMDTTQTGLRDERIRRINKLINLSNNYTSIQMTRIKKAFEEALGPELAKHYYIQGGIGERKGIGVVV